jgi:hypothetical protein
VLSADNERLRNLCAADDADAAARLSAAQVGALTLDFCHFLCTCRHSPLCIAFRPSLPYQGKVQSNTQYIYFFLSSSPYFTSFFFTLLYFFLSSSPYQGDIGDGEAHRRRMETELQQLVSQTTQLLNNLWFKF